MASLPPLTPSLRQSLFQGFTLWGSDLQDVEQLACASLMTAALPCLCPFNVLQIRLRSRQQLIRLLAKPFLPLIEKPILTALLLKMKTVASISTRQE